MQVIAPEIGVQFERMDLGSIGEADFPAEAHRIAVEAARARIDLTQSPSWRFTLIRRSESDHVLLVNTHHIVSDRWSVGLLMQEPRQGVYRPGPGRAVGLDPPGRLVPGGDPAD